MCIRDRSISVPCYDGKSRWREMILLVWNIYRRPVVAAASAKRRNLLVGVCRMKTITDGLENTGHFDEVKFLKE